MGAAGHQARLRPTLAPWFHSFCAPSGRTACRRSHASHGSLRVRSCSSEARTFELGGRPVAKEANGAPGAGFVRNGAWRGHGFGGRPSNGRPFLPVGNVPAGGAVYASKEAAMRTRRPGRGGADRLVLTSAARKRRTPWATVLAGLPGPRRLQAEPRGAASDTGAATRPSARGRTAVAQAFTRYSDPTSTSHVFCGVPGQSFLVARVTSLLAVAWGCWDFDLAVATRTAVFRPPGVKWASSLPRWTVPASPVSRRSSRAVPHRRKHQRAEGSKSLVNYVDDYVTSALWLWPGWRQSPAAIAAGCTP